MGRCGASGIGKPRRDTVENLIEPHTPVFNVSDMSRGGHS
jgi:hypothetical protein